LKNGDDLVFGESNLTHGDLLRGHNQYAGRSLKVNGSLKRDAYTYSIYNSLIYIDRVISAGKINDKKGTFLCLLFFEFL
ncbi:hypothetical protein, partial [Rahnella aceris]|uniref:hypothetical protein n=1 Tax=Rahnella sp. (strain Y9602) TaxID=2703885 RepID=UPI001C25CF0A